ncbi:MAG: GAF domain-containing protein, partial [Anaerolineae bacterium]|nr:GAF domain-containing protein [Anaerolineae bacterium]
IIQPRTETLEAIKQSRQSVLIPAVILTLIGLLVLGGVITQVVLRPVGALASVAEEQIAGDLSARVRKLPPDEFGDLGRTFNTLSQQLDSTLKDQESVIAERTRSLEEHSAYLESSAEVSQRIASYTDTNQLISEVVKLIKERFSLYYVGLFLVDEKNEWAVLQAGTGEAGKRMLERKHQLKIGKGMIGWSIANAEARIALDVGDDAVQFENPDLPETRSEGALPLRSRGEVLGALTIQSETAAAFTPEIISTLQTMVDQIAIAIDNAELLAKNEAVLEAERKAYGELSQEDWLKLLQRESIPRYISDTPNHVRVTRNQLSSDVEQRLQDTPLLQDKGLTALIPIKIRGHILGGVKLRKEEGHGSWTKEELEFAGVLAEQVSVALESARLFDQSQRRVARERVIGETSARIRETLDIESVLETAAQELHKILGKVETEVWLDAENPDTLGKES